MPFRYSCFISFRHGQGELAPGFIKQLFQALSNEIETLIDDLPVYVDWKNLRAGDFYNPALARALCESVCMIVVYTPVYFSHSHTYCAREYRAMQDLEQRRLALLPNVQERQHGLIIPIILRGPDRLPAELRHQRHFYDFSNITLASTELSRHPEYAPLIRTIAEYIAERYHSLRGLTNNSMQECDQFALPDEAEIRPWLEGIVSPQQPLPGR